MIMIGKKYIKGYLDPKLCFDLYVETGSIYKVVKILHNRNIVNPKTGKAPTPMGVWQTAWRYILANMVEGRKGIESAWRANGELLTDKDWYKIVVEHARYAYRKTRKFDEFMEQHKYLTPYL